MTSPLESENIITNISTYLPPNDLFLFSAINKSTYDSKLNPINNPLINSLYRSHVISKIYLGEFSNDDDIKIPFCLSIIIFDICFLCSFNILTNEPLISHI